MWGPGIVFVKLKTPLLLVFVVWLLSRVTVIPETGVPFSVIIFPVIIVPWGTVVEGGGFETTLSEEKVNNINRNPHTKTSFFFVVFFMVPSI